MAQLSVTDGDVAEQYDISVQRSVERTARPGPADVFRPITLLRLLKTPGPGLLIWRAELLKAVRGGRRIGWWWVNVPVACVTCDRLLLLLQTARATFFMWRTARSKRRVEYYGLIRRDGKNRCGVTRIDQVDQQAARDEKSTGSY